MKELKTSPWMLSRWLGAMRERDDSSDAPCRYGILSKDVGAFPTKQNWVTMATNQELSRFAFNQGQKLRYVDQFCHTTQESSVAKRGSFLDLLGQEALLLLLVRLSLSETVLVAIVRAL